MQLCVGPLMIKFAQRCINDKLFTCCSQEPCLLDFLHHGELIQISYEVIFQSCATRGRVLDVEFHCSHCWKRILN